MLIMPSPVFLQIKAQNRTHVPDGLRVFFLEVRRLHTGVYVEQIAHGLAVAKSRADPLGRAKARGILPDGVGGIVGSPSKRTSNE